MAVHYHWHALHGRKVRQLYVERRSGREVAIVEADPGVAIVLAALGGLDNLLALLAIS